MQFVIRSATPDDCDQLLLIAKQAELINLPPDREYIAQRIAKSVESFARKHTENGEYLFVAEEYKTGKVVGTSGLFASYVSTSHPLHFMRIYDKEGVQHYSRNVTTQRMSGIGGFVLDKAFRGHPQKLGKQLSLMRGLYIGMHPERFADEFITEIMAETLPNGDSAFWRCFGEQFTGLSYQQAYDATRKGDRSFMESFPNSFSADGCDNAPICLTENSVPEQSKPSQYLVRKLGFRFLHQADPMDGALHYGVRRDDIPMVAGGKWLPIKETVLQGDPTLLAGTDASGAFRGGVIAADISNNHVQATKGFLETMQLSSHDKLYVAPLL